MNQNDFEEFRRLENMLNEKVISPIDFWQRIRELKSMSTGALNKIQQKLQTEIVQTTAKMKIIPTPQVPFVQTTYNDPATHSHYIQPRTTGEKMLGKLDYKESVMIMGNTNTNQRTFERMRAEVIDYIEFSKGVDGDIYFTSSLVRKTHAPYGNPKEPKQVTRKELDAIIQIITEWMD